LYGIFNIAKLMLVIPLVAQIRADTIPSQLAEIFVILLNVRGISITKIRKSVAKTIKVKPSSKTFPSFSVSIIEALSESPCRGIRIFRKVTVDAIKQITAWMLKDETQSNPNRVGKSIPIAIPIGRYAPHIIKPKERALSFGITDITAGIVMTSTVNPKPAENRYKRKYTGLSVEVVANPAMAKKIRLILRTRCTGNFETWNPIRYPMAAPTNVIAETAKPSRNGERSKKFVISFKYKLVIPMVPPASIPMKYNHETFNALEVITFVPLFFKDVPKDHR
jgi:hypothetical protein|tara:strand:- start:394 stop:1230 length:837 start_codon:yes stop_codon:yes gene_type:complete